MCRSKINVNPGWIKSWQKEGPQSDEKLVMKNINTLRKKQYIHIYIYIYLFTYIYIYIYIYNRIGIARLCNLPGHQGLARLPMARWPMLAKQKSWWRPYRFVQEVCWWMSPSAPLPNQTDQLTLGIDAWSTQSLFWLVSDRLTVISISHVQFLIILGDFHMFWWPQSPAVAGMGWCFGMPTNNDSDCSIIIIYA